MAAQIVARFDSDFQLNLYGLIDWFIAAQIATQMNMIGQRATANCISKLLYEIAPLRRESIFSFPAAKYWSHQAVLDGNALFFELS